MHLALTLPLCGLAALAIYQVFTIVSSRLRWASLAKQWNCQPAPDSTKGDFLGIGNLRAIMKADKEKRVPVYLANRVKDVSKREGRQVNTFHGKILTQSTYFTVEPKNIQALLATQFKDFHFGPGRNGNFGPLLGEGIFASDGHKWEHSRAMLRPNFAREQVSDLDLEEQHVQNLLRAVPVQSDGWTAMTDIQPLFFRLTLDSATEFLFGESVDSQLMALPDHQAESRPTERDERLFSVSFDRAQLYLAKGARFGDNYWIAHNAEFKNDNKIVHAFVDYYVQLALKSGLKEKIAEEGKGSKQKYVFLEEIAKQTRDPIELRDHLLNILLAGRDTTASTLGWFWLLMADHPDVFRQLRNTVVEEFGTFDAPNDITFARLKSCSYLQHVLNEVLRLYPIVPMNGRRAAKDTSIPLGGGPDGQSPVFISKGTEVGYSVHIMHRRKDLWGEDAEDFKPERWSGRRVGWEYLPFNGGPRICLGQQFALTELSYVIVRMLQRFDEIDGSQVVGREKLHGLTLTNCPGNGVPIRMRKAA